MGCGSDAPAANDSSSAGSGGVAASGGQANGSGGAFLGGAGGGSGGDSPVPPTPQPSSGCGKADPVVGARTVTLPVADGAFIVSLPASYDPNAPLPLGFAFHGHGRTHAQCQAGDCAGFQSVMKDDAILVYMKSVDAGWEGTDGENGGIRERNVAFFEKVFDLVEDEYCVDERRVFVAGTSSGAHFTNILACRFGDRLLAAAPVAGYLPEQDNCVGQVAALPIHGIDDDKVVLSSGEEARDFYIEQNGCSSTAVPTVESIHAQIRASRDAAQTDVACVDYQGCDQGVPVRWCEHSEGGYDNSTHGWPTAGGQLIWDFVKPL